MDNENLDESFEKQKKIDEEAQGEPPMRPTKEKTTKVKCFVCWFDECACHKLREKHDEHSDYELIRTGGDF